MLRGSDWAAIVYFSYLAATCLRGRGDARDRAIVAGASILAIGALLALAALVTGRQGAGLLLFRDWAYPGFLIVGYWLPARLVTARNVAAERVLLAFDRRWAGGVIASAARAPRLVREVTELAYLLCYPVIPGGLALLAAWGHWSESDRYWTALMTAGALCYGVLPWLATRPPRALERLPDATATGVRRLNLLVLDRASVQLNTCPSGHVATSVAAALVVGSATTAGGLILAGLALLIIYASVVGRYHYAIDALVGMLVGGVAFEVSRWV